MISKLPDLVKQKIFEFLPTTICCKNFLDLSIIVTNKHFRDFIKDHFKYKFLNNMIIITRTSITKKKLKTSIDTRDGKLCCHCARLNLLEQKTLQNLLNRYKKLSSLHQLNNSSLKDFNKYIKRHYDNNTNNYKEELSMLNIHFTTSVELTNFIIKMDRIKSNLWFDSQRCCNGSGCNVEIII